MSTLIRYRILPPTAFGICLLVMLALRLVFPIGVIVPFPFILLGIPLIGAGAYLTAAGHRQFQLARTNIDTFETPTFLVIRGVYRYSRNPMYLGFGLVAAGVALLLGAVSPWLSWLVFIGILDRGYIAFEEERMRSVFGQGYIDYQARTRRWV